jgi:hypothetical protein
MCTYQARVPQFGVLGPRGGLRSANTLENTFDVIDPRYSRSTKRAPCSKALNVTLLRCSKEDTAPPVPTGNLDGQKEVVVFQATGIIKFIFTYNGNYNRFARDQERVTLRIVLLTH